MVFIWMRTIPAIRLLAMRAITSISTIVYATINNFGYPPTILHGWDNIKSILKLVFSFYYAAVLPLFFSTSPRLPPTKMEKRGQSLAYNGRMDSNILSLLKLLASCHLIFSFYDVSIGYFSHYLRSASPCKARWSNSFNSERSNIPFKELMKKCKL